MWTANLSGSTTDSDGTSVYFSSDLAVDGQPIELRLAVNWRTRGYRLSMTSVKTRKFIAAMTGSCGDPVY